MPVLYAKSSMIC